MRRIGLSAKLVMTVGILATAIVTIASLSIALLVYVQSEQQIKAQMTATSKVIIKEYLMGQNGQIVLQKKDEGQSLVILLRNTDMSLYLADSTGAAVAKYGIYRTLDTQTVVTVFGSVDTHALAQSRVGLYQDKAVPEIGRIDTYTSPLYYGNDIVGYMQLARVNYIWPVLLRSLLLALLIQLPLTWIVSALVIRWGTQATLAPLAELVRNVETMDVENLPESFQVTSSMDYDVRILTQTLQTLMARIRSSLVRQRELAQNLSHEFKTPLARVNARVSLVRPHVSGVHQKTLDDVTGEMVHLAQQVDGLLDVAIHEASTVQTDTPWTLSQLFSELTQTIPYPDRVILEIPKSFLIPIPIGKARTLWRNILENAAKYGPKDGVIHVRAGQDHHRWTVTVSNTVTDGASRSENVFVRYYRGLLSRSVRGHGLGMAIVRDVGKQLGLDIRYITRDPSHIHVEVSGANTPVVRG